VCYNWSLQNWSKKFSEIYARNDDNLTYSQHWMQVVRHTSRMSEDIRQSWYKHSMVSLVMAFVWILSFTERVARDLEVTDVGKAISTDMGSTYVEWVLNKYPLVCALCGNKPCTCSSNRHIIERRKEKMKVEFEEFKKNAEERIQQAKKRIVPQMDNLSKMSLNEFLEEFGEIYKGTVYGSRVEDICFHLQEEVGEVTEAIWGIESSVGPHTPETWKQWFEKHKKESWNLGNIRAVGANGVPQIIEEIQSKGKRVDLTAYGGFCREMINELADIFSWVCAMLIKIRFLLDDEFQIVDIWTGQIFTDRSYYTSTSRKTHCPHCLQHECTTGCIQSTLLRRLFSKQ